MSAELDALREKLRPAHAVSADAPTRIERPTASGSSDTAERALHIEEAARAQGFSRAIVFLAIAALGFLPFQPGIFWVRMVFAGTLAFVICISAYVWWRSSRPERYTRRLFRLFGVSLAACSAAAMYYCGVFSAAPVIVTLGISFYGQGDDRRWALIMPVIAIAIYFLLALGITLNWIPELGLFRHVRLTEPAMLFAVSLVPAVFLLTLWQARLSRKATRDAVERLDEALRMVQQREALLQEARADLDQALGGRARGPWSGRRVGDYEVGELIGRGASGEIYRASKDGAAVAVKILAPDAIGDDAMFERFRREADIARRLSVPNVVRVLDVGQAPGGTPFIAMELLDGQDLGWHLRRRTQMTLAEVVHMTAQVAAGLEAAHAAGVVHRDLKPQNLFLAGGVWKILDFGVAKLRGSEGTLTRGAVIGTPGYMSPEQARGQEAETRSDVFSLGAVVYRALTGQPPFAGRDLPESLFQIVYGMPARPSGLEASLSPEVDAVLAIALAKNAEDRFASATELADALRLAATGKLDTSLRVHAAALIANLEWGTAATPR